MCCVGRFAWCYMCCTLMMILICLLTARMLCESWSISRSSTWLEKVVCNVSTLCDWGKISEQAVKPLFISVISYEEQLVDRIQDVVELYLLSDRRIGNNSVYTGKWNCSVPVWTTPLCSTIPHGTRTERF